MNINIAVFSRDGARGQKFHNVLSSKHKISKHFFTINNMELQDTVTKAVNGAVALKSVLLTLLHKY
jgi:hypothetical protein